MFAGFGSICSLAFLHRGEFALLLLCPHPLHDLEKGGSCPATPPVHLDVTAQIRPSLVFTYGTSRRSEIQLHRKLELPLRGASTIDMSRHPGNAELCNGITPRHSVS